MAAIELERSSQEPACARRPARIRLASLGAVGLISDSGLRVEWIAEVIIAAGTAALGYLANKRFYVKDHRSKATVNLHIQKDNPKIVHAFDMEDLGDKAVYCRCWRSKKSPFCDGAHTKHNEETGDNVGPLIIKKKET
ncbi:CDGSH iron-sulfur domain-containing protein 1-like [Perognathus longimembris pacificus]|uniref:CDGSH iron-sulfur domain-containing protein 1-like n=1 Tax=Perognathus longimembris pacificus TaxID=214514 RepID=UPI002019E7CF|nr:CDGSH iron-sulfur domain-containing protein 1-like [Perognathus longimembris pacificus]